MSDPETVDVPHAPEPLAAREVALKLIDQVMTRRQAFDASIENSREFAALPGRDRAFVRMIAATTLRRLGQIDDLIRRGMDKQADPSPPLLHHH